MCIRDSIRAMFKRFRYEIYSKLRDKYRIPNILNIIGLICFSGKIYKLKKLMYEVFDIHHKFRWGPMDPETYIEILYRHPQLRNLLVNIESWIDLMNELLDQLTKEKISLDDFKDTVDWMEEEIRREHEFTMPYRFDFIPRTSESKIGLISGLITTIEEKSVSPKDFINIIYIEGIKNRLLSDLRNFIAEIQQYLVTEIQPFIIDLHRFVTLKIGLSGILLSLIVNLLITSGILKALWGLIVNLL